MKKALDTNQSLPMLDKNNLNAERRSVPVHSKFKRKTIFEKVQKDVVVAKELRQKELKRRLRRVRALLLAVNQLIEEGLNKSGEFYYYDYSCDEEDSLNGHRCSEWWYGFGLSSELKSLLDWLMRLGKGGSFSESAENSGLSHDFVLKFKHIEVEAELMSPPDKCPLHTSPPDFMNGKVSARQILHKLIRDDYKALKAELERR